MQVAKSGSDLLNKITVTLSYFSPQLNDHQTDQATETAMALVEPNNAISDLLQQREAACCPTSVDCNENDPYVPNESSKVPYVTIEASFSLPDLNLPIDDDSGSEVKR